MTMQNKELWHAVHRELNKWKIKPSQTEKLRKIDIIILLSDLITIWKEKQMNRKWQRKRKFNRVSSTEDE